LETAETAKSLTFQSKSLPLGVLQKNDNWFLIISKKVFKIERSFSGSKRGFRQQVWDLGIFPYRYLEALKISRKSGADSFSTSLVSYVK